MDWKQFLDKTERKYDKWIAEGKIVNTSKVIPIGQSLESKNWVLPTERVMHYLKNSRVFAVGKCRCRSLGKHCDRPVDVCFFMNDFAEKKLAKGEARTLSLEEAEKLCQKADQAGLVPTTLMNPDDHVFAVCHCCPCCCHDLQIMMVRGKPGLTAHSEYIAMQDEPDCSECGLCVERCHFGARTLDADGLHYDPAKCFGCGLCVTTCPDQAISMVLRRDVKKQSAG